MPKWLNTIVTAAVGGAVSTIGSAMAGMDGVNWHHIGIAGGLGALISVANLFRQSPNLPTK